MTKLLSKKAMGLRDLAEAASKTFDNPVRQLIANLDVDPPQQAAVDGGVVGAPTKSKKLKAKVPDFADRVFKRRALPFVGVDWILSWAQHSCDPNCHIDVSGKMVHIYTVRPVSCGEPLTLCFTDPGMKRAERLAALQSRGISCDCRRCTASQAEQEVDDMHLGLSLNWLVKLIAKDRACRICPPSAKPAFAKQAAKQAVDVLPKALKSVSMLPAMYRGWRVRLVYHALALMFEDPTPMDENASEMFGQLCKLYIWELENFCLGIDKWQRCLEQTVALCCGEVSKAYALIPVLRGTIPIDEVLAHNETIEFTTEMEPASTEPILAATTAAGSQGVQQDD